MSPLLATFPIAGFLSYSVVRQVQKSATDFYPLLVDAGLGIFAKERFESDVVFGPYWGQKIGVADVTPNMDQSYMWDVRT